MPQPAWEGVVGGARGGKLAGEVGAGGSEYREALAGEPRISGAGGEVGAGGEAEEPCRSANSPKEEVSMMRRRR